MSDPAPAVSTSLARLNWSTRLNLVFSAVCVAIALVMVFAFPSVFTGIVLPVAVYALYTAIRARRSAKRTSAVLARPTPR
jgi:hypothetical protein